LRCTIHDLAARNGLKIAAASTHPFAHWTGQNIFEHDRYMQIVEDHQVLSRSLLIFGLHVHVGVEDRETAIHIMNAARYFLPHVLALSTSSPFWVKFSKSFPVPTFLITSIRGLNMKIM
jgi:carboxylate-amine ligase